MSWNTWSTRNPDFEPYINSTENIWAKLKYQSNKSRAASISKLKTSTNDAWNEIPEDMIRNLV